MLPGFFLLPFNAWQFTTTYALGVAFRWAEKSSLGRDRLKLNGREPEGRRSRFLARSTFRGEALYGESKSARFAVGAQSANGLLD
jgi:hypothetical protein